MAESETKWERKARQNSTENTQVIGVSDYREHFKNHGKRVLDDRGNYDARRIAAWAPYVILPAIAVASRMVPVKHRPRFWVGTLVCYSVFSTIMYNTDTSNGDPDPEIIRVA